MSRLHKRLHLCRRSCHKRDIRGLTKFEFSIHAMRAFIHSILIVLIFSIQKIQAADAFTDLVLASKDLTGIAQKTKQDAELANLDLACDWPMKIFAEIVKHPSEKKNWDAVHHYHSMVDGAYSLMFKWACFDTLIDNPTLFRDRYIEGDDRASELMRCAMWSDGSARNGNLYGAVTKHNFKDLPSFQKWLFETLDVNDVVVKTESDRVRQKNFIERAKTDLADAEKTMNSQFKK